jgi:hypothetical protein
LKDLRAPTIVVMAACDTAALAATHNTPANAWLAAGARSVLATYFPVHADHTLVLHVRLMANLADAVTGGNLRTWAHVVSKTLALQRYLDYVYSFREWRAHRGLPELPAEVTQEYTYLWNTRRLGLRAGYKACLQILRDAIAHFGHQYAADFDTYLATTETVPHTMFFTHLGSPETIVIRNDSHAGSNTESPTNEYWLRRAEEDRNQST